MTDEYYPYKAQEALQDKASENQHMNYAIQNRDEFREQQSVLVEQTNPKKIVKDVILRLRGLEESYEGTLIKVAEPKLNKEGIDNIWFILDSHINQNVILSHLERSEISHIMEAIQEDIVDDLSLNWKTYGIKKKTDLDMINDSILYNVFMALKRAEGQNEKNWLGKVSFENVNPTKMPQPKRDTFFSNLRL